MLKRKDFYFKIILEFKKYNFILKKFSKSSKNKYFLL